MKQKFISRRERFKVLATRRTNKVLNDIRIIGHCSNSLLYDFKPSEIDKIFNTIQKELDETKMRFKNRKEFKFSLNENYDSKITR